MAEKPIAYVKTVPPEQAGSRLREAYDAVKYPDGTVENMYLSMTHTPDAIVPAHELYLALLHNADNPLEPWLAELVSVYVAHLCGCGFAFAHHSANFRLRLGDKARADAVLTSIEKEGHPAVEDEKAVAALAYARKLTLVPADVDGEDIEGLRRAGFCDKGISYIIQLTAGFAYWSRMTNGLGTRLDSRVGAAAWSD